MNSYTFKGHPDQYFGHLTYSQHGEDLMIANLFRLLGIEKPSYLDLGAHHPIFCSNTKLLYDRGSRGVNIEANPNLIEAFIKERPEDVNVCVGVGTARGNMAFFKYSETSGLNTFCSDEVENLSPNFKFKTTVDLPMVTLADIIREFCSGVFPDFLSCDIEGLDYAVLETLPKNPPGLLIICVETRRHETQTMRALLNSKGFSLLCRMGENLIFIADDAMMKAI